MPVVCLLNIILCLLRRKCYTCICKISGSKCQKAVDLYTLNVYIMIIEEAFMKQVYPVIFTQLNDKKDTVLINVPDMNILTEGFGLPDAIEMARDAIGANGITLQDLGMEIPVPSDISDIDIKNGSFDNTGISHVSFVDIDFDEYRRKVDNKTVRRNVTLPNWLNQEAEKSHINVSRVLQEALMVKLGVSR